jgi:hypothetical protein
MTAARTSSTLRVGIRRSIATRAGPNGHLIREYGAGAIIRFVAAPVLCGNSVADAWRHRFEFAVCNQILRQHEANLWGESVRH